MENYRTIVALSQIKALRKQNDFEGAYEIVKTVNLKKVSDILDCNMLADICNEMKDYSLSAQIYEKIYKKTGSRHALSSLVYMNIKKGDSIRARDLLEKYMVIAPKDPARLIYQYRIEKMEKRPIEQQIRTLKAWSAEEYNERWAAELAKLYHKAGDDDSCIEVCNNIINWSGEGEYVEWAKALKAHLLGEIDITGMAEQIYSESNEKTAEPEQSEEQQPEETEQPGEAVEIQPDYVEETEEPQQEDVAESIQPAEEKLPAEAEEEPKTESAAEQDDESWADNIQIKDAFDYALEDAVENAIEETLEASEDEVHEILPEVNEYNRAASQTEDSEAELENTERFMDYLSKNNSQNVKLREEESDIPDIGGAFGQKVSSGEIVLEELFGNYARIESIRKQLVRSLDMIFDPLKHGNCIIMTGGPKTGRTTLAKKIAKAMNKNGILESTKALIIDAEKLNRLNFEKQKSSLVDCTIIVENAGKLSREMVANLINLAENNRGRVVIFLEDVKRNITALLRENTELNSVFNNRIHLPAGYKMPELKGFVYEYLVSKDYELEVRANMILEEKLENILKSGEKDPIKAALDIAKAAVDKANARNTLVLTGMAKSGKIENIDIMSVIAEDFE